MKLRRIQPGAVHVDLLAHLQGVQRGNDQGWHVRVRRLLLVAPQSQVPHRRLEPVPRRMGARHEHRRQHVLPRAREYVSERQQRGLLHGAPLPLAHRRHLHRHKVHEAVSRAGATVPPPVGVHQHPGRRVVGLNYRPEQAVHVPRILRSDHPVGGAAPDNSLVSLRRGVVQPHDHLMPVNLLARADVPHLVVASIHRRRPRSHFIDNDALRARHHRTVIVAVVDVVAGERWKYGGEREVPAGFTRRRLAEHEAVLVDRLVAHDDVEVLGELGVGSERGPDALEDVRQGEVEALERAVLAHAPGVAQARARGQTRALATAILRAPRHFATIPRPCGVTLAHARLYTPAVVTAPQRARFRGDVTPRCRQREPEQPVVHPVLPHPRGDEVHNHGCVDEGPHPQKLTDSREVKHFFCLAPAATRFLPRGELP
mmetsp:Transcript_4367/g.10608  ORF Transcript_4367/g.10608 Transcript_4367/m.10608 type:complete len:428 (+) Transcript_4367:359-1642(+)